MFDSSGNSSPTPSKSCMKWFFREKMSEPFASAQMEHFPPCPCSGFHAIFSPDHAFLPGTDCFISTHYNVNNDHSTHLGMVRNLGNY